MADSELFEWQKEDVLASHEKTKTFAELVYWHKLHRVKQAHRAADIALSRLGIFVQDDIKSKLQQILDLVRGALIEDQINHEHPPLVYRDRPHADIDQLRKECATWMGEAEVMIKARLWADGSVAP